MRLMLYDDPHPTDLEGWKQHLEWLRALPDDIQSREVDIEDAELVIALLENANPSKTAR